MRKVPNLIKFLLASLVMIFFFTVGQAIAQVQSTDSLGSAAVFVTSFELPTIFWYGVGLLFYFMSRFRIATATVDGVKWSLGTWFSLNYVNFGCIVIFIVYIIAAKVKLPAVYAIGLGTTPNLVIDWVQRELKALGLGTNK